MGRSTELPAEPVTDPTDSVGATTTGGGVTPEPLTVKVAWLLVMPAAEAVMTAV